MKAPKGNATVTSSNAHIANEKAHIVNSLNFDKIQKNELTKGKWFVIEKAKTPPEVKELEEKKKSEAQPNKGTSKA